MSITADRELLRAWLVAAEAAQEAATPLPWRRNEKHGFIGGPVGHGNVAQLWNKHEEDFTNSAANVRIIPLAVNALPASILAIQSLLAHDELHCLRCDPGDKYVCPPCEQHQAAIIAVAESLRAGGFHA